MREGLRWERPRSGHRSYLPMISEVVAVSGVGGFAPVSHGIERLFGHINICDPKNGQQDALLRDLTQLRP
jgi:hypothetical protein